MRILRTLYRAVIAAVALQSLAAPPALAHAFGVRYDLPLPLGLYLTGAGAAVLLSFIVMARFLKRHDKAAETSRFDLLDAPGLGWLGSSVVLNTIRGLSVAVFALLLWAAFFGNANTFRNIAPPFVWIIWWVGMAFTSALAGNLWALINPWKILYAWAERACGGITPSFAYPARLGQWPAVAMFLMFAWLELISGLGEQPRILGLLIVAYSAVTWIGMVFFGRETWLRNGEIFAAVFGLLSRFAPLVGEAGRLYLRPPAVGLLNRTPVHPSSVCFVLLLLTTVTYDGILETPMWTAVLDQVAESQALRATLIALQNAGVDLIALIKTIALIALPCLFIAVYVIFAHAIAMFGSGGRVPTRDVAGYFVLSLVPIAVAYHLSHYLSYLLIGGQYIIPLASDPFGLGWDLFGSANYRIDIGIVNAKAIWYVAVSAIVIGHVLAVYVAHVMAMWVFADRGAALRSQLPMLVLMIVYTMISLWILSQPIVN